MSCSGRLCVCLQVAWGSAQNLLGVNTVRDVYILNEQHMVASYKDQVR